MRLAKYFEDYGLRDWSREQYEKLEVKADKCISCHKCEGRCPYGLQISSEMKRIDRLLKNESCEKR